ncbi:lipase [Solitalea longa]|uniref:Lipase n=1 Tax=Solitalea longa TaxID=2079460 RepID=A0A2S5A4W9_9SPHI|nr:lipase [Solitalea longa]POY37586.1 lipase [Solitalea longa]
MKSILRIAFLFFVFCFSNQLSYSQQVLRPGFDANEYADLLALKYDSLQIGTTVIKTPIHQYRLLYESPEVGLYNRCYFWMRDDNVIVLCIRGTIAKSESWLENLYSAMVPAQGNLQINDSTNFKYKLSAGENACVHVGWMIGLAHLAPCIVTELNKYYKSGNREVIIFGHSQGGVLSYLVRSYLNYLPTDVLPTDIYYKTYCSAAPKPGNLQYAYDFDFITRVGGAYRVVNSADWVPEAPFTLQTTYDINEVNPITNYQERIKSMSWIVRAYINNAYKKMNNNANTGVKYYQKYFGHLVYQQIKKTLPQLKEPEYAPSSYFYPAGTPVVLFADNEYNGKFKFEDSNLFIHHKFDTYLFLLRKYYSIPN